MTASLRFFVRWLLHGLTPFNVVLTDYIASHPDLAPLLECW
jgi:hypothetical protein